MILKRHILYIAVGMAFLVALALFGAGMEFISAGLQTCGWRWLVLLPLAWVIGWCVDGARGGECDE
jgi:membrane-associated PAP2 superfamily phosphatase